MADAKITAIVTQDTAETVTVEIKDDEHDTVGYLEITKVPKGVRVQGWHGDDSETDEQLLLHKRGEVRPESRGV